MKTSGSLPPTFSFGVFELNPRSGELRKQGMRIRLQGQPVEILVLLLEHPGQVVTREELQKKLWPADTFVDFEQGLNNAMKRLRAALDDNAETPHFIETVPRRGYRFIVAVNGGLGKEPEPTELAKAEPHAEERPARSLPLWARLAGGGLLGIVVAAALLGLNVHGWRDRLFSGAPKPQVQALAVLPLANLSGDPEQEYFADGMTEALITELGKISGPRVISRQSAMQYKGSKKLLQEIARELNVDAVLEGAVEHSGDRVRVTVHLSQASPERQLWAKQFNSSIRDILALQDEIARAVTDEVQVKLTAEERARLATARSVDPQAQEDYLRARYLSNLGPASSRPEAKLRTAVEYYKRAIAKDPGYAPAYVGLAGAYFDLGSDWGIPGHSENETLALAKAAVAKALELDPTLGEAHVARAWGLLQDWNWQEAEKEARLGVTQNPNYARAHHMYSMYLSVVGRHDEAISHMNYAIQLDPLNPDYKDGLGWTACRARQYDLAIQQFGTAGDNLGLAFVYMFEKLYPEAIGAAERNVRQFGRDPIHISTLAMAYGFAGRKQEAQMLVDELKAIARKHYVPPIFFIHVYSGLGDKDQALRWTKQAYEDRDQYLLWLKTSPSFDTVRSEPQVQALLRRMNFPP